MKNSRVEEQLQSVSPHRLEAFSDAVIAIVITIMVLELRPPEGASLSAWRPLIPVVLAYILSFTVLAIYWNNHHHLLRATKHASAGVMWANMFLLFWLSLIPIVTAWLGPNSAETWPAVLYGFVGLMAGNAYFILVHAIKRANPGSTVTQALEKDYKGKVSQVMYLAALPLAFISPYISYVIFAAVAVMWVVPDRRLTRL